MDYSSGVSFAMWTVIVKKHAVIGTGVLWWMIAGLKESWSSSTRTGTVRPIWTVTPGVVSRTTARATTTSATLCLTFLSYKELQLASLLPSLFSFWRTSALHAPFRRSTRLRSSKNWHRVRIGMTRWMDLSTTRVMTHRLLLEVFKLKRLCSRSGKKMTLMM